MSSSSSESDMSSDNDFREEFDPPLSDSSDGDSDDSFETNSDSSGSKSSGSSSSSSESSDSESDSESTTGLIDIVNNNDIYIIVENRA